jgi:hypothetical protein
VTHVGIKFLHISTKINFATPLYLLLTHYCVGDEIKKTEMGWACSAYGEGERCVQGFDEKT